MTNTPFEQLHEDHGSSRTRVDQRTDDRERISSPALFGALDPAFLADPYPVYARIRADVPVYRSPLGPWLLTRYAEVAAVLRDARFGRAGFERHFAPDEGAGPDGGGHRQSMLFRDPPHHTRLRDAVSRAFTLRAVEAFRPRVQARAGPLLDRVAPTGGMDVVADLAEPLPRAVIGELLGIPEAHRPACAAWSGAVARSLDALPIPEDRPLVAKGQTARRVLGGYFRELVASRRAQPRSDLVSTLIEAADQDGPPQRCDAARLGRPRAAHRDRGRGRLGAPSPGGGALPPPARRLGGRWRDHAGRVAAALGGVLGAPAGPAGVGLCEVHLHPERESQVVARDVVDDDRSQLPLIALA